MLKLGEKSVEKIRYYTDWAGRDYRDILAWAEYPRQMKTAPNTSESGETKKIRIKDRQEYLKWLYGADWLHIPKRP